MIFNHLQIHWQKSPFLWARHGQRLSCQFTLVVLYNAMHSFFSSSLVFAPALSLVCFPTVSIFSVLST